MKSQMMYSVVCTHVGGILQIDFHSIQLQILKEIKARNKLWPRREKMYPAIDLSKNQQLPVLLQRGIKGQISMTYLLKINMTEKEI